MATRSARRQFVPPLEPLTAASTVAHPRTDAAPTVSAVSALSQEPPLWALELATRLDTESRGAASPADVEALVSTARAALEHSRVHDFVSISVERRVRADLRAHLPRER